MTIDKHYPVGKTSTRCVPKLVLDINKDTNWHPEYIVGITRGGNIPATIMSPMLDVPGEALKTQFTR